MANKELERLIYYKGQALTAQDFQDQQEYHIEKLKQLVGRFSYGIGRGLNVVCDPRKTDSDFDAFKITGGLAIDAEGNSLVVPEEGLRVDVAEFDKENPYLSLRYREEEHYVIHSVCDCPTRNNRVKEGIEHVWRKVPNLAKDGDGKANITVARILLKDKDEKRRDEKFCERHVIVGEDPVGPTIRLKAAIVTEEQIAKNAISTEKIQQDAVTQEKIQDAAVTQAKLADDVSARPKGLAGGDLTANYPDPLIGDGKVTETKIVDSAVTAAKIRDGAVTKVKLAADLTVAGGDLAGSYPDPTIRNGAVTQAKLAAGLTVPPSGPAGGDLTGTYPNPRIQDGAITQAKLAGHVTTPPSGAAGGELDGTYPNPTIRNGSVTQAKLAAGVTLPAAGPAGGDLTGNYPNPLIGPGKVTEGKLAGSSNDANDAQRAVTTDKIRNAAVTSKKLSIVSSLRTGTLPGGAIDVVTVPGIEPNAIVHVIPTVGALSWSSKIKVQAANQLEYTITLKNEDPAESHYNVLKINLGS